MLNFFFTTTALSVPANVQAINDILFPIVLFFLVFTMLYTVFIDTLLPSQEIVSNEESAVDACESNEGDDEPILEQQLANMAAVTEEHVIKLSSKSVELFDVEQERDRLCAFGVKKLRAYCKQRKLKGYSTPASAGIDALAEFMLKHQIYARDVEGLFHGSKNVA